MHPHSPIYSLLKSSHICFVAAVFRSSQSLPALSDAYVPVLISRNVCTLNTGMRQLGFNVIQAELTLETSKEATE